MAIPSIPQNFYVQQGNGTVFLQWDLVAGATAYSVQRSTDGVNYTIINAPTSNFYEDTNVTIGTYYYYQVASTGTGGTGSYTDPQNITPTLGGEMSLAELGRACLIKADRLYSAAIPLPDLNTKINNSLKELYDLLITAYEDYYKAPNASFATVGGQQYYDTPNGARSFIGDDGSTFVAAPIYKLLGVDLSAGGPSIGSQSNANNGWLTVDKFMFADRNRYVYPNSASQIYGVLNLQYRWMGDKIEFIPIPSANQMVRLQYIPRLPVLLKPWDITTTSISGWLEYVIVDVAMKILTEEESDVTTLAAEKMALKDRIESAAQNKDAGKPDRISDVRRDGNGGYNGPIGGY